MSARSILLSLLLVASSSFALDNGLARVPQRGWNTWNKYGCDVNSTIVLKNAQALVDEGLKDLGYEYVVLDDCYQDGRDPSTGRIKENMEKFPGGLKNMTDQIHALGLKAGIYSSAGTMTCGRHVGSLDHEEVDAQTFADWGFDYLKYDNCYNEGRFGTPKTSFDRYNAMGQALNKTGRPILYSMCNWGEDYPWLFAPTIANSYRISGDIYDSFNRPDARCPCDDILSCSLQGFHCSVRKILTFAKSLGQKVYPGAWADLDMLEVGNGGMTTTEYVTHFSMWAMMRSPMILGNDLTAMDNATRAIIKNKHVLNLISGDSQGSPAYPAWEKDNGDLQLWFSNLANDTYAIALVNWQDQARTETLNFADMFVDAREARNGSYIAYDLWQGVDFNAGTVPDQPAQLEGSPFSGSLRDIQVEGHGVRLFRLVPSEGMTM